MVTVIEMLERLADESFGIYREALMLEMEKYKIIGKVLTKCLEITPMGIKVETKDGKQEFMEADTVIYALGMKPNSTAELKAAAGNISVYEVGDCVRAAKVVDAIVESYMAALNII
jgi:pyruvate/2-oxoglutarate dehydrogenase complex dihydrolipoamide dehydrogenase (E3) component